MPKKTKMHKFEQKKAPYKNYDKKKKIHKFEPKNNKQHYCKKTMTRKKDVQIRAKKST